MRRQCPQLDQGLATLLADLKDRGLLESTLVWCCGEFGRTPKVDWQPPWNGGRNHYGNVFTVLVAGGGFKGGHVVGSSDAKARRGQGAAGLPGRPAGQHLPAWPASTASARLPHPDGPGGPRAARRIGRREVGRAADGDHVGLFQPR